MQISARLIYDLSDLMMIVLEITALKKVRESEISAMKDSCAMSYGGECNSTAYCMICLIKDDVRDLIRFYESSEEKMSFAFFKKLEAKLLNVLKRMAPSKLLLLSTDQIEMVILTLGLELIRSAFNMHTRGVLLGSADRLDHMLNMSKAAISKDVLRDLGDFAEVQKSLITVWNDAEEDKNDFTRTHMIHHELVVCVGCGYNVQHKKNWNGQNLEGIKVTEKEMKKRLRMVVFNDDLDIKFEGPVFDLEKGTFDINKIEIAQMSCLDQPLLPSQKSGTKKIIIR